MLDAVDKIMGPGAWVTTPTPHPHPHPHPHAHPHPHQVPPLAAISGDAPVSTLIEEHELPAWTAKLYAKQAGRASEP